MRHRAAGSNSACYLCARRFRVCQFSIVLRDPKISIAHLRHRVRFLREPRIFSFAVLIFAHFHDTLQVFHARLVSDLILSVPAVHDQPTLTLNARRVVFAQKQDARDRTTHRQPQLDPCAVAKYSSIASGMRQRTLWITSAALARVCRRPAKIGPRIRSRPARLVRGCFCGPLQGIWRPSIGTSCANGHCTGHGFRRVWRRGR
jgi:hypothetical protein